MFCKISFAFLHAKISQNQRCCVNLSIFERFWTDIDSFTWIFVFTKPRKKRNLIMKKNFWSGSISVTRPWRKLNTWVGMSKRLRYLLQTRLNQNWENEIRRWKWTAYYLSSPCFCSFAKYRKIQKFRKFGKSAVISQNHVIV